jgi:hypothetical protein
MAAPTDSPEQAFRLRRFAGVNTLVDPVFLGPQFLALAQNWIPNQTYRLSKKPGSLQYIATGHSVTNITALGRYYLAGQRYLYWYGQRLASGGNDAVFRTVEDVVSGGATQVVTFTNELQLGRMIRYGDYLYVGNGIEPLWQIPIAWDATTKPAVRMTPIVKLPLPGDPGADTVTVTAENLATNDATRTPTGSYAYAWAVYNTVEGIYTQRSDPQTITVNTDQHLRAKMPTTYTLGPNEVFRLFLSIDGWPIEYATRQGNDFSAATPGDQTFGVVDVTNLRVPITNNVNRTGNMFTVYQNQVVFAGNADDPNAVCATGVILPGLEQDVYNQGAFFPAGARVQLPARVTGLGVSGQTSPSMDPRSPLVVFCPTKTFLYLGNPFDPNTDFAQIQLSDRIGCPAHDTIVPTPAGLIFMGMDSVYLVPPNGEPPQDIGWPIADQIRAIGTGDREQCTAIYHKFFYKLAIPDPGGGTNTVQWWLDLRQTLPDPDSGGTPSWWGPHLGPPVSAFATAMEDPDEQDKGFGAYAHTDVLFLHHQMNLYYDVHPGMPTADPIISVLRSGVFDADQPFQVKVFTRVRSICRAALTSTIKAVLFTDGTTQTTLQDIVVKGPKGAKWYGTRDTANRGRWAGTLTGDQTNSHWIHLGQLEIQTITPVARPRGLSVELLLTHADAADVQLRDFEILFIPTERKVRYLGETVN